MEEYPDWVEKENVKWQLWRQDDHGNRVIVGAFDTQEEANKLKVEFEARGHKQVYWVEKKLK
jgi:cell division protein FtsN